MQSHNEDILRYKVKPGDNLYTIAKKFNINKTQLMSLNGLNNSKIYAGQNLIIRNEI
jgi:N-acetylmuramoyl-L-alanine amidase